MYAYDTGSLPAVEPEHCEHLDASTVGKIDAFIGFFVRMCNGNGRLNLIISGGKIQDFEPTSRISNKSGKKINGVDGGNIASTETAIKRNHPAQKKSA